MSQMELQNSEMELIKVDLVKRLLELERQDDLKKEFNTNNIYAILESYSVDEIRKKVAKIDERIYKVGDIIEVDDEVYIIIGVDKRGYICLDDIYFCAVDRDKDIIKLGHSDAFDECMSEIKQKKQNRKEVKRIKEKLTDYYNSRGRKRELLKIK